MNKFSYFTRRQNLYKFVIFSSKNILYLEYQIKSLPISPIQCPMLFLLSKINLPILEYSVKFICVFVKFICVFVYLICFYLIIQFFQLIFIDKNSIFESIDDYMNICYYYIELLPKM